MNCTTALLIAFVALFDAGPAFTQTPVSEQALKANAKTAAFVYTQQFVEEQTNTTIELYNANAAGKLSRVGSYTLDPVVKLVGSNGKYMIAGDSGWAADLYTYAVGSNGSIGDLVSTVDGAANFGSSCVPELPYIANTKLDHTGKYLYVLISDDYNSSCSAWESYEIGSNGSLIFLGVTEDTVDSNIETISSSDKLAYGVDLEGVGCISISEGNQFSAYRRDSAGVLEPNLSFTHIDPRPDPSAAGSNNDFFPYALKADPAGHLAVLMQECLSTSNGASLYLASYTIDKSTGGIKSTNSWKDMPVTAVNQYRGGADDQLEMSPSGKFLAVYSQAVGFQVFRFNGADPITPLSRLTGYGTAEAAWDSEDHLYVQCGKGGGSLCIYGMGSKAINLITDFPFPSNGYLTLVVPKL